MTTSSAVGLIRKKRDGGTLSGAEIESLLASYVRGDLPDYQMSAFLMAVYYAGMSPDETLAFTDAMLRSGDRIDLSGIAGTKVDKHSTGGVGDKVSLILAPMVAACGVLVPMISGRGLGHTGGTLDKLESIPGFRTDLGIREFIDVLTDVGFVMAGQTGSIVPADRKLYALRDVTGTIESLPLIAGSIMSKKLAEGIDALVLDVKTGDGAFMATEAQAEELARLLVSIGEAAGKRVMAFITSMDSPLGNAVGNWLEVVEAVACLRGKTVPDLMELTYTLGGAMVMLGGKAPTLDEGMQRCREAIWSGRAYETFLKGVRRQGGDVSMLENPGRYPAAAHAIEIRGTRPGYVRRWATRRLGELAVDLGAGRRVMADRVHPSAGITIVARPGDRVEEGRTLGIAYTDRRDRLEEFRAALVECVEVGDQPPPSTSLLRALITKEGKVSLASGVG